MDRPPGPRRIVLWLPGRGSCGSGRPLLKGQTRSEAKARGGGLCNPLFPRRAATALHEARRRRTLCAFQGGRREPAETVLTALVEEATLCKGHPAPPPLEPDPGHAGEGTDVFSLIAHGPCQPPLDVPRSASPRTTPGVGADASVERRAPP